MTDRTFSIQEIAEHIQAIQQMTAHDDRRPTIRWHMQRALQDLFGSIPSPVFWENIIIGGAGDAEMNDVPVLAFLNFRYREEKEQHPFFIVYYLPTGDVDKALSATTNDTVVARPADWSVMAERLNNYTDRCKLTGEEYPKDLKFLRSFVLASHAFIDATYSEVLDLTPGDGELNIAAVVHLPQGISMVAVHNGLPFRNLECIKQEQETGSVETRTYH